MDENYDILGFLKRENISNCGRRQLGTGWGRPTVESIIIQKESYQEAFVYRLSHFTQNMTHCSYSSNSYPQDLF